MNISQLNLSNENIVETNRDNHYIIRNEYQRDNYIAKHGDIAVEFDSEFGVWRSLCEDMNAERERYIANISSYFTRFGTDCE